MKLIHDGGYTTEERESFKEVIYSNTLQSMRVTLEAMELLNIPFQNKQNENYHRHLILEAPPQIEMMNQELVQAFISLWEDQGVRICLGRSNEYQLNDSAR